MLRDSSKLEAAGKYGGARVYIPSNIVSDSQFPFKIGENVQVAIEPTGRKIVITSSKQ